MARHRMSCTTTPFIAAVLALGAALTVSAGCDKPVPPSYTDPIGGKSAGTIEPMTTPLSVSLKDVAADQKYTHTSDTGGITQVAYDGKKVLVELSGLPDSRPDCPVIAYWGQRGGTTRFEHRFRTPNSASVSKLKNAGGKEVSAVSIYINGKKFGGKAPRALSDAGVYRFTLPTAPSDFALHVEADTPGEGCTLAPVDVTLVGSLTKGGGLTAGVASPASITVVGVRPPDIAGKPISEDKKRYMPGDTIMVVGTGLETAVAFVDEDGASKPIVEASARRASGSIESEGDSDTLAVHFAVDGKTSVGPTLSIPVEGTVHRIGDAIGAMSGAIWGLWLVILLVSVGVLMTILNGFPQFRGFWHAIQVVRGKYDHPDEKGEISHFQALTAALSATVGLGNIAGVAVAVTNGGPGAVFWMWVCGFLGMATKFSECTLATAYREVRPDGTVAGGPMYYMKKQLGPFGFLAFIYAPLIVLASFGGGNMFQSNQAAAIWHQSFGIPQWVTGIILVVMVGSVIIGGIKRIGRVTDKLVPAMCGLYVAGALAVIFTNLGAVPEVFSLIFTEAFSVSSAVGGVLGIVVKDVVVQGFRRAAFSNEAGFGSAAIAHAAVKTDEPVREGTVALLEPFIDTIVICTMTALVILISGEWTQQGLGGVNLTAASFDRVFDGFGTWMVGIAVFLFAISTMISWSYYGEKGVEFFLGAKAIMPYRIVFICLVFVGSVWKLGPVLDFSDAMLGLLIVPNCIALLMLIPKLRAMVKDYFSRLGAGDMKTYK